jgi:hypothetical protein
MQTENQKRQEKKKVVTVWIWRTEYFNYRRKADAIGLPLGSLARLLLKNYCEGKIDLKL